MTAIKEVQPDVGFPKIRVRKTTKTVIIKEIKQDATGTEDGKYRAPTAVCTQCKNKKDENARKVKEHAESVTNAINSANVGTTNVSDISKLEAIISRYNALTQEEKDAVDGGAKSKIETIKAKITELKKKKEDDDKAKAKTVSDLLATLPASSTMTSANADTIKTSKITPARTKYNELTKDQKDKVTNYNKLTELEEKYNQVKASGGSGRRFWIRRSTFNTINYE